ncbi:hypothetical protein B296_00034076 [Ensete ventricosum]|uniref:Uncharacterized protein n=1 Tax=Ensete ventricosum TaxID=4639 RepID=A0A426XAQ8_ENSVE|nr:hypothetical protein B296_00034076 [Ensete ventricosum]
MDGHDNTSEEATSARGTKLTSDLESEVEVPEHDDPCPRPMPLQPHVLRMTRSYPEGRLSVGGASSDHPLPPPERPVCRIAIPETTPGTSTELPVEDPRGSINPQEVLTPTDVGGLAHSNENRSSRHLSSTPESSVTFFGARRRADVTRTPDE